MQQLSRPLTPLGVPSPPMSPQSASDVDWDDLPPTPSAIDVDDLPPLTPDDSPISSASPSPTDGNFNSKQHTPFSTSEDMGLFKKKGERKGKDTPEPQNPYASQPAQDEYTSQAPPRYESGNQFDRPEKSPAWTTQDQRYGNGGSYGRNGAYGSDKFGSGAQPSPSRQGGYGGLGPADDRSALLGARADRSPDPPNRQQPLSSDPPYRQQPAQPDVFGKSGPYNPYGQTDNYGTGARYDDRENLSTEERERLEIRDIKQETQDVRGQSLNHLNNATQAMYQALETGRSTMGRLHAQGDSLHNSSKKILESSTQARVGAERTAQLKVENRSMFAPRFGSFTSSSKAMAEEDRALANLQNDQAARANIRAGQREAHARADDLNKKLNTSGPAYQTSTLAEKANSKYLFDDDEDSDEDAKKQAEESEEAIGQRFHELTYGTRELKAMAISFGEETDYQNKLIESMSNQAQGVQDSLERSRMKLSQIR